MEFMKKLEERFHNEEIGYEPKCKVCNSQFQNKIESQRENNKTFKEISKFLEENGENISQMALSRHFSNHYPRRKAYNEKIKALEDEKVQNAIKSYPFLKEVFGEKKYLMIMINHYMMIMVI